MSAPTRFAAPTAGRRASVTAAALTLLLPVALVAGGCGSGGPEGSASAPPATTAAAVATITPEPAPATSPAATTHHHRHHAATDDASTSAEDSTAAEDSLAGNTDPSAASGTADSAPGREDAQVPVLTVDAAKPVIKVSKGQLVAFRAVSGSDDTVKVEGYKSYPLSAGVSRIIRFTATRPGRFAISFDEMGQLVGTLVVS